LIFTGTPAGVGPVQIGDVLKGYLGEQEMFQVKIK
jgi:2-keto-4-pentenoate hydratase/2-oxohepta-3-ene-1,7-dioic acid hydratase in catechol pathway